ncbi:MAG: hypothetical protein FJ100_22255 [Deltaproteobacteria bacterium]|nr:hypothetical protein [Deltaproteobacteria bacterium]
MDATLLTTCATTGALAGVACNWLALGATKRQLPGILAGNADAIGRAVAQEANPGLRLRQYLESNDAREAFRRGLAAALGALDSKLKVKTRDGAYEYVSIDRLSDYLAEHMTEWLLSADMEHRLAGWLNALYRNNYDTQVGNLLPQVAHTALDGWFVFLSELPGNNTDLVDRLAAAVAEDQRKLREVIGSDTVDDLLALYDSGTTFVRDKGLPLIDEPKVHAFLADKWTTILPMIRRRLGWLAAVGAWWKVGTPDDTRRWMADAKNRGVVRGKAQDFLTSTVEGDLRKAIRASMRDLEEERVAVLWQRLPPALRQQVQAWLREVLAKPEVRKLIVGTLRRERDGLLRRTIGFYMDKVGGWRKPGEPVDKAIDRVCRALFTALRDRDTRQVIKGLNARVFNGFVESFASEVQGAPDHDRATAVADRLHAHVVSRLAPQLETALGKVDARGLVADAVRGFATDTLPSLLAGKQAQELVGYLTLYGAIPGAIIGLLAALIAG